MAGHAEAQMPDDVSLAELWRMQLSLQRGLADVVAELRSLPDRISTEIESRSTERVDALRRELDLRLAGQDRRITFLERVVWSVVATVVASVGLAVLQLVVNTN